jgi:CelD/BcsL family acetyltransferase involved in cellulose biosynthesis
LSAVPARPALLARAGEPRLATKVITDGRAWTAMIEEWRRLWRSSPDASPFQSPDWLMPWWEVFGTDRPRIVSLRRDDVLIGLMPLYRLQEDGQAKLLPVGAGLSDYHDALVHSTAPHDAVERMLDAAVSDCADIDRCDLPDLPPKARLLRAPDPPGWRSVTWAGEPCPVLVLKDDLRHSVPSRMLRKWRMAEHRAQRRGENVEVSLAKDIATAKRFWQALVELHRRRWTARGEPDGVLADPRVIAFHERALTPLLEATTLRLYALSFGGKLVAVNQVLLARERLHFYLGGFDEAYAFESPGTILLGRILQSALQEGLSEMHFLRGGEAYKFAWGGIARQNRGRSLTRS